jgi:hypothetical protein
MARLLIQQIPLLNLERLRCVMKWMRERDALMAQTLAFVQSVTDRKGEAGRPKALPDFKPDLKADLIKHALKPPLAKPHDEAAPVSTRAIDNTAIAEPPQGLQISWPNIPGDFRREMQERIAGFRKHQERFNRERAEYFNATLAKLRAALDEAPPPRLGK